MTLDKPERRVVRRTLDVTVVPAEVVRAVEGDEQLAHLARARHRLDLAERCEPETDGSVDGLVAALDDVDDLASQRVFQLLDDDAFDAVVEQRDLVDDERGGSA